MSSFWNYSQLIVKIAVEQESAAKVSIQRPPATTARSAWLIASAGSSKQAQLISIQSTHPGRIKGVNAARLGQEEEWR